MALTSLPEGEARSARSRQPRPALRHTEAVQVTSECRVDAPVAWVRSFLLAGTIEDDVTVAGDVVEVRQHDRVLDLVVRNRLTPDDEGGTRLEVEASLRLLGLARVVGGVFRGRVRRTLERSLDRLPTAIEQALAKEEGTSTFTDPTAADPYVPGIVEGNDFHHTEVPLMADQQSGEQNERHDASATTVSEASQDSAEEADDRVPQGARETLEKTVTEAGAADGVTGAVKRVAQEVDRTFSGEYEAREDQAAAQKAETEPERPPA